MLKSIGELVGISIVLFLFIFNIFGIKIIKGLVKIIILGYYLLTFTIVLLVTYFTRNNIKSFQSDFIPYSTLIGIIIFIFTTNRGKILEIIDLTKNREEKNRFDAYPMKELDWLKRNYDIVCEISKDNKWILFEILVTLLVFIVLHILSLLEL